MLDFMRRNARSWGIRAALGLITLVFIFFMGGGGRLGAGPKPLVKVGSIEITRPKFDQAQRRNESYFRQQFQGQLTEQMLKSLDVPKMTLDQLVDGAVLRSEGERVGLHITEEAIRDQLMRVPAFQSGGKFSPGLYRETLRAQGMSPGAFEESVREDLLQAQMADIIRRGSHVSEEDAWQDYQRENRKMSLSYLGIDSAPLEKDVTVTDEAVTKFYDAKQETWRRPASVKVRYLPYRVTDIAAKVEVSDVDLNEYYDLNKATEFAHDEEVAARHILKKVAKDAGDDAKKAARAAIDAIAKKLADGGNFEEIAKAESDDTGSAVKGGDLGFFGRGRMVPTFEAAAFSLDTGKVSDVVETDFGYHLILVYDKKPAGVAAYDEVKDKIHATLAALKAKDKAFDDSAEDAAKISDGSTLDAIATARGVKIEETPLFSEGSVVPGVGNAPAFMEAAFALAKPGDASQPVKVGDDLYVIALAERKESYVPPLAEIRSEVESAYRLEQATDLARKRADELLAAVKGGKPLAQVAEENNLEVGKASDIGGAANVVKDIGPVQGLSDVAFSTTKDGEALARSFVVGGKAYVFVRDSVTEASRDAFTAVKDDQLKRLETAREQEALQEFIRSLKEKAKISYDLAQLRPLLGDKAPVVEE